MLAEVILLSVNEEKSNKGVTVLFSLQVKLYLSNRITLMIASFCIYLWILRDFCRVCSPALCFQSREFIQGSCPHFSAYHLFLEKWEHLFVFGSDLDTEASLRSFIFFFLDLRRSIGVLLQKTFSVKEKGRKVLPSLWTWWDLHPFFSFLLSARERGFELLLH